MPGMVVEGVVDANAASNSLTTTKSVAAGMSSKTQPSDALEIHCVDTSIDQLYDNVCDMESSADGFLSRRHSFGSDGDESRIDSELRHLVGSEMEVDKEEEEEVGVANDITSVAGNGSKDQTPDMKGKAQLATSSKCSAATPKQPNKAKRTTLLESDPSKKLNPASSTSSSPEDAEKSAGKTTVSGKKKFFTGNWNLQNGSDDPTEAGNLGPYLLKHARTLIQGDNHRRALDYAVRATKALEKSSSSLDLVMSLHVLASIHCSLGQHALAVPVLLRAIDIPVLEEGHDQALAKFAGHMQLGDTYGMLGQLENAIRSYSSGLEVQKKALGGTDSRVGETCRYLAEVHVQALQFSEAEKLCKTALDIHKQNGETTAASATAAAVEEIADRRLMGLICETKGDHEAALEHFLLASMAMSANDGQETEVAHVDCSIGDVYLNLTRYDEAIFAYQKALARYKSWKGENHPAVASVFVRLADLYHRTGKIRESKSYCENALRIYGKPPPGTPLEEIATGYTDVSAIYESMNENEHALKLLQKALKIYDNVPGQQSTIAGIQAQMGVLHYMTRNFSESYTYLADATAKLRATGEKKSAFFGVALNQMGLACVQRYAINEAAALFEEARDILEQERGPYHPDTLRVYSNLAGTYDAMGRVDDAIEILEKIVIMREEKLGTANPDVDEEKRRLAELLREAGKVRSKKVRSLENLLS